MNHILVFCMAYLIVGVMVVALIFWFQWWDNMCDDRFLAAIQVIGWWPLLVTFTLLNLLGKFILWIVKKVFP